MASAVLPEAMGRHPGSKCYSAPDGLAFEDDLFDRYRAGSTARAELYMWRQARCLVTTRRLAARPQFARVRATGEAQGWPIATRRSGGGTVFHGPGILCVTLLERVQRMNVAQAYDGICALLIAALRDLGVEAEIGPLPAAPCDGRFNLLLGGRKLAGTAARISPAGAGAAVLAHAALTVDANCRDGIAAVERFERALGFDVTYSRASMTSLAEHIPGIDAAAVAAAISRNYRS